MRTAENAEPRQEGERLYSEEQSPLLYQPLRNRIEMTSSDVAPLEAELTSLQATHNSRLQILPISGLLAAGTGI